MTGIQAPKITETLSEDVHTAVDKTFSQMFGLEVKSTFRIQNSEFVPEGDIFGSIDLNQGGPQGWMVLTFPKDTLFAILKTFYKRDFTEIDDKAVGAVGEITNIVFGVFKHRVSKKGHSYSLALPKIAVGAKHRVAGADWVLVGEFTSGVGPFTVHITRVPDAK